MPGFVELVKRANRTRSPEHSVALRATVLAAVMVGVIALAIERAVSIPVTALVLVALPVAYWVSYLRREKDNLVLKLLISIFAIAALFRFFGQLRLVSTLDEVRFPLADLFLWIQVLHGFDLPARKDLKFSLGSSLALMAIAGSLSQDFWFAATLIPYFALAILALALAHRSEIQDGVIATITPQSGGPKQVVPKWDVARGLAVTLVAGTVLFLVIPQPSGLRTFALPFSAGEAGALGAGGGVANPGFEDGGAPSSRSIGSAFYGFNESLNLRVRGELNDNVVMRVRASAPAMWRGLLFDHYDGVQWTGDTSDPRSLEGDPPFGYPVEFRSLGPRSTKSQTFYVEAEQPNVVFTGGQPESVWVDEALNIDDLGGLRLDATLTEGAVYSVVSSVGAATPEMLRSLPSEDPPADKNRYLQIPPTLPQRVGALAERITRNAPTTYDKVRAIETWLANNYEYSIESPVPPPGQDAVDHFLFETDVGFCEQFASATIMMLRSLDIPARMVAGYAVGTRNPFTGYYEIKNSDAHTWVDVWFPNVGWYEFDPTFAIPPAEEDAAQSVPLVRAFRFAADRFRDFAPKDVAGYLRAGLTILLVAVALAAVWLIGRRLRPKKRKVPVTEPIAGGPVTRALKGVEDALAARGVPRAPPETAAELLARTGGRKPELTRALKAFEQERYGSAPPPEAEAEAAIGEFNRLAVNAANGESDRQAAADR
jgi:transglutaminase-like putative cysteine protease